jgi:hypothetical protein
MCANVTGVYGSRNGLTPTVIPEQIAEIVDLWTSGILVTRPMSTREGKAATHEEIVIEKRSRSIGGCEGSGQCRSPAQPCRGLGDPKGRPRAS